MLAQESWYITEQLRVATQEIHVNYVTKREEWGLPQCNARA